LNDFLYSGGMLKRKGKRGGKGGGGGKGERKPPRGLFLD